MHGLLTKLRRFAVCLLCVSLIFSTQVYADTQDKIDDTRDKINDLEQQKQDAQNQINDLQNQKGDLEGKLGTLNTQLSNISASLDEVQEDISEKNTQIQTTQAALYEAQQKSAQQYEDMKKRIQFMYENGSESFTQILFEAQSFSDFLNKADYVEEMSSYDRDMLNQYQQTQAVIAQQEVQLETEQQELTALEASMQDKQSQVNTLISDTQTTISQYMSTISNQQSVANELQSKIDEQKAYEDQLEIQKAKEDAARLAEIKRQEAEDAAKAQGAQGPVVAGTGDEALLAALIYCEAGGESYEGQLAVGSVVINRVRSERYPGSISGVIYQSGQFSPVASGRLATVLGSGLTSASAASAAREVLAGNVTNNFLYFRANNGIIEGTVIGNHVFY